MTSFNLTLAIAAGEDYIKILQSDVILIECKLLNYDSSQQKNKGFTTLDILTNINNWCMVDKLFVNAGNGKLFDRFAHTSVVLPKNDGKFKNKHNSTTLFVYGGYGNNITNDAFLITINFSTKQNNNNNDNNNKDKDKNDANEMKADNSNDDNGNTCDIGNFSLNCVSLNPKQRLEKRHGHSSVIDIKNNQIIHFGGKKSFVQMAQNNGEIQRVVIQVNDKGDYIIKEIINDSGKEIKGNNNGGGGGQGGIQNQMDAWAQAENDELQQILLMSMIDK